ncbi:cytochrome b, partial [Candidatus Pelagibacter sp.]|nr:cytochrome b [Candidatus Pelagibacter sp.]
MFNYKMHNRNTLPEYSLISKLLHWASAILLFVQIPLGFYLVDLDFGPERINIENIHVLVGLSMFYLVILRLINKIINPPPKLEPSIFKGQKFLAK